MMVSIPFWLWVLEDVSLFILLAVTLWQVIAHRLAMRRELDSIRHVVMVGLNDMTRLMKDIHNVKE